MEDATLVNTSQQWWEKVAQGENLHWFSYREQALLLDVNSGAIFGIDAVTLALLNALAESNPVKALARTAGGFSPEQVAGAWAELDKLHHEGLLLGPDPLSRVMAGSSYTNGFPFLRMSDGASDARELAAADKADSNWWSKALCLNVAHACNMSCQYCFAGKGCFGSRPQLMSLEVGKAAVDYLLAQAPVGSELEIDFFGGEPLLNFALVEALLPYGLARCRSQGKTLRYTLTTNGLLLDREKSKFLNEYGVQLILSLDGRPEVNDRCRSILGGGGSYASVVPRILEAVETRQGRNYFIRGTYTRYNLDFSEDVRHLAGLGLREISVEPVVSGPSEDYSLRTEDLPAISDEYDRLVEFCLQEREAGKPINFFHFQVDLEPGLCLPKRLRGCGAGYQYLAVSPEGNLYPCHQFVGREEFCLGSLSEGITNRHMQEQFATANILSKSCRRCWARYFCGGGCHASNFLNGSKIENTYELGCSLARKRLECAIYLRVSEDSGT